MSEVMTTARQLDVTDDGLIAAIVAGKTTTEAAAAVGLSATMTYRRMRRPGFRAALAEARAERWREPAEYPRREVRRSIETLVALRDGDGHPSTRLRAAVSIIEQATKLHELVEVLPRHSVLEAQLAE